MAQSVSTSTRTCVACRRKADKGELVRIVRRPNGDVDVDEAGRAAGRGAYLCPTQGCLSKAVENRALNAALKTSLSAGKTEELTKAFNGFIARRAQEVE